jgi:hypothetical protein
VQEAKAGVQRGVLARKEGCVAGGVRGERVLEYEHESRRLDVCGRGACASYVARRSRVGLRARHERAHGRVLLVRWRGWVVNTLLVTRCTSGARGVCASEAEYEHEPEPEPEPSPCRSTALRGVLGVGVDWSGLHASDRRQRGVVGSLDAHAWRVAFTFFILSLLLPVTSAFLASFLSLFLSSFSSVSVCVSFLFFYHPRMLWAHCAGVLGRARGVCKGDAGVQRGVRAGVQHKNVLEKAWGGAGHRLGVHKYTSLGRVGVVVGS